MNETDASTNKEVEQIPEPKEEIQKVESPRPVDDSAPPVEPDMEENKISQLEMTENIEQPKENPEKEQIEQVQLNEDTKLHQEEEEEEEEEEIEKM